MFSACLVAKVEKRFVYVRKKYYLCTMKHIRIISPSGAIEPAYITQAQQRLESWGFRVSVGTHAFEQKGRFAGTSEERLADINEAFSDPDIDIILSFEVFSMSSDNVTVKSNQYFHFKMPSGVHVRYFFVL